MREFYRGLLIVGIAIVIGLPLGVAVAEKKYVKKTKMIYVFSENTQ